MTDALTTPPHQIARHAALALCLLGLGGAFAPARAQSALSSPPLADDPSGVWTIMDENASISSAKLTDRYYTNGLRLGWMSGTGVVPEPIVGLGRALWGAGQQRVGIDITQQIYTPANTSAAVPPVGDRPYAGVLMANFTLTSDTPTTRSTFGLGLGILGPAALGEQVQNGFHDLIGQGHNNGWSRQLRNEPELQLLSERTWRLSTGSLGGLQTEALPDLTASIGTLRVYAQTGVTMRIGSGLEADFGAPRLRPGQTGGDVFTRPADGGPNGFGWYVFAGVDGRATAYDVTLDGNLWQHSASVSRQPFMGEASLGVAILMFGTRLTYTQIFQTAEFRHQKGGIHQLGSLALSVRF